MRLTYQHDGLGLGGTKVRVEALVRMDLEWQMDDMVFVHIYRGLKNKAGEVIDVL